MSIQPNDGVNDRRKNYSPARCPALANHSYAVGLGYGMINGLFRLNKNTLIRYPVHTGALMREFHSRVLNGHRRG